MTYDDVLKELKWNSNKTFEKIFDNHGAQGQSWGVKVGDLKKIQKKSKRITTCRVSYLTTAFLMGSTWQD